jgi:hypothetical protein
LLEKTSGGGESLHRFLISLAAGLKPLLHTVRRNRQALTNADARKDPKAVQVACGHRRKD